MTMMKNLIHIILILIAIPSFGQDDDETNQQITYGRISQLTDEQLKDSGPGKLMFVDSINDAVKLAEQDINNGTPFLLLQGGIAPVIISTDPEFENDYDVFFYEFGCIGPDYEFIVTYNQVIFEYLTKKHKNRWLKEVRKDVVGLKEWKKNK